MKSLQEGLEVLGDVCLADHKEIYVNIFKKSEIPFREQQGKNYD